MSEETAAEIGPRPLNAEEEAEYREHFVDGSGAFVDSGMVRRLLVTLDAVRATPERREDGWEGLRREIEALPFRDFVTVDPQEPDVELVDRAAVLAIVDRLAAAAPPREPGWKELRRLAEAATPGPWEHIRAMSYRVAGRTRQVGPMVTGAAPIADGGGSMQFRGSTTTEDADAAYIAAVSPDVVLRLLAARTPREPKV